MTVSRRLQSLSLLRTRWLLGLLLCLATPAAQELVVDVVSAVTDVDSAPCCSDDCDESGMPCTQQCAGSICGARALVMPTQVLVSPEPVACLLALLEEVLGAGMSGHTEPPFRPPAV